MEQSSQPPYQPQPPQYPQYYQQTSNHSAIGTASLILGIIALIFCVLGFISSFAVFFWPLSLLGLFGWIGLILGIIGLILGIVAYWGQWKDKRGLQGFVLGLISIILFVVAIVIGVVVASFFYSQMMPNYPTIY